MADYKRLYYELFNKVTDIIEELKSIQIEMEEKYIGEETKEEKIDEYLQIKRTLRVSFFVTVF